MTLLERDMVFKGIIFEEEEEYDDYKRTNTGANKFSYSFGKQFIELYDNVHIAKLSYHSEYELQQIRSYLVKIYNDAMLSNLQESINECDEYYDEDMNVVLSTNVKRPCPKVGCYGVISNNFGVCPDCDSISCNVCEEIKNSTHICNPQTIATLALLKKDSKPCPSCHSLIFKISGCFMMYCTVCKTGFDWNTEQKIEIDSWFHNPHMERQNNNNHINNPCEIHKTIMHHKIYSQYNHIPSMIERRRLLLNVGNEDLRILYMLHVISEEHFKELIYQRWKLFALYTGEIAILQGVTSRLLENFMKFNKVKEQDYGMIYKDTNASLGKLSKCTGFDPITFSLKNGIIDPFTYWTYNKHDHGIVQILYKEWYYFRATEIIQ